MHEMKRKTRKEQNRTKEKMEAEGKSQAQNDGWMSQGRQKKGQISGGRYRLVSSLYLSICQDKWHHERLVWADSAWWEVSALSYGSAGGICTGGPSCGNHCSVGRWAGAIRPPASHQLSSLPSVCIRRIADSCTM